MIDFVEVAFRPDLCRRELDEFGKILSKNQSLTERKDILPFFKARHQLAAYLGTFHPNIAGERVVAYELGINDDVADLVVGDSATSSFCFVEFEDAAASSVFARARRSAPRWSNRFLHAFGQIVDWVSGLDDLSSTETFMHKFGSRSPSFYYMIVAGRSSYLDAREHGRVQWFSKKVLVDSSHVACCTFDDLYIRLNDRLTTYYPAVLDEAE